MAFGYDFGEIQMPGTKKKATSGMTAVMDDDLDLPTASPFAGQQTPTQPIGQAPQQTPTTAAPVPSAFAGMATSAPQVATASGVSSPSVSKMHTMQGVQTKASQLAATSDPRQKALLQDEIERDVIKSLTDSGHKVQVKNGQLLVDGRPYVIGDGQPGAPANGNTGVTGYGTGGVPRPPRPSFAPAMNVGHDGATSTGLTREQYRDAWMGSGSVKTMADLQRFVAQHGGEILDGAGRVRTPFGEVLDLVENLRAGGGRPIWSATGADAVAKAQASGAAPFDAAGAMSAGAAGASALFGSESGGPVPSWAPTATPYQPGTIADDDIPDLGYERLFEELSRRTSADDAVEAAVLDVLANPESLDATTIGRLKAQSKDALAQQAQLAEADLVADGIAMGIDDSRWMASERNALKRDTGRAVVDASRDVEIEAATRNADDRRAAASLGASYASDQAARRQSAVSTAAGASLQAAAARGDRMALREQMAAEASRQGLSVDDMTLRYTTSVMDDLSQRYGIDVSAMIDREQLAQAGREFQEDLIFRFQQLAQQDRQFGADYGLQVEGLNQQAERDAFDRYKWLYE